MGWALQRDDDVKGAIAAYTAGLRTLGTSYDYAAGLEERFISRRLKELGDDLSERMRRDPYFLSTYERAAPPELRDPVRQYWMSEGKAAEARGDHARAYQHYYHAGWDRWITDYMDEVLEGLVRSAAAAGFTARHRVAQLHLASLRALDERCAQHAPSPPHPSSLRAFISRLFGG